jgi:hypothetical protein
MCFSSSGGLVGSAHSCRGLMQREEGVQRAGGGWREALCLAHSLRESAKEQRQHRKILQRGHGGGSTTGAGALRSGRRVGRRRRVCCEPRV